MPTLMISPFDNSLSLPSLFCFNLNTALEQLAAISPGACSTLPLLPSSFPSNLSPSFPLSIPDLSDAIVKPTPLHIISTVSPTMPSCATITTTMATSTAACGTTANASGHHTKNTSYTSTRNKMGRSYNPGRPLAMADREKILVLYNEGYKISHIARIIGVTHSCVSKIMTRYRRTGSMDPRSCAVPRNRHKSEESMDTASESEKSMEDDKKTPDRLGPPETPESLSVSNPSTPRKTNVSFSIDSILND